MPNSPQGSAWHNYFTFSTRKALRNFDFVLNVTLFYCRGLNLLALHESYKERNVIITERKHYDSFDCQVGTWQQPGNYKRKEWKRAQRDQLATCLPAQVGLLGIDCRGLALSCFRACCSDRIQLLGCELPYGDTHVAGTRGGLRPKAIKSLSPTCEKPNPANSHMSELESGSAQSNPDRATTVADTSTAALWEILSQGTRLSCAWIPDSQKLWDNKCHYG